MKLHKDITAELNSHPNGKHVGAFFDFDRTVISGLSAKVFLQQELRRGTVTPRVYSELMTTYTNFTKGRVGFSEFMLAGAKVLKGTSESSYIEFGEEVYRTKIARMVFPEARALIDAHLAKGHTVVLLSAATRYQVEPAARDLGVEHVVCSQLGVKDGLFTGKVIEPTCHGQGKVIAVETLAKRLNLNLAQSFFYSDGNEDLPVLEIIGNPRPINPNLKLAAAAHKRGWLVRRFNSRGRPKVADVVRTVATPLSLVSSVLAGVSFFGLTKSKTDAINYSLPLFADTSSALMGMEIKVRGEHNLWSHRPAVFIFNHQSNADGIILAKLLRRDFVSVGKKELASQKLIGKLFEVVGTVFIDRGDAASARAAMAKLLCELRDNRRSVVIAPEGTRSISPNLNDFKKGAFQLAKKAGVAIVPIVIHNAGDVLPKGGWVCRAATVEVDVLTPIETSEWRVKDMGDHIEAVRQSYLDTLEQEAYKHVGSRVTQGDLN